MRGLDKKGLSTSGVQAFIYLAGLGFAVCQAESDDIWNTPAEDISDEQAQEYGTEVLMATAGMGLGLSWLLGLVMFISFLVMCCRCKRLHREDMAIASGGDDNDGKGLDDMYEREQYDDTISRHRKILWLGTLLIFLGYMACAGIAYKGAKASDESFADIFDGTNDLLTDVQEAMCAEGGSEDCTEGSLGDFLLDIGDEVVDQLEGIVVFIGSLGAVVAPLTWVSNNLTTAGGILNSTEASLLSINSTIGSINLIFAGNSTVGDLLDTRMDAVEQSTFDSVSDGRDALEVAEGLTLTSQVEAAAQMTDSNATIVRIQYQLDSIEGNEVGSDDNMREMLMELIMDILEPLHNTTRDIDDFQEDHLEDARDLTESNLDNAVMGVAGFIFLPGAILFVTSLCAGICRSSKPLYLNMCFVFWFQIVYCAIAGLFLTFAKLNRDLCDHHMELVEANVGSTEFTFRDVRMTLNATTIDEILSCQGRVGDVPTSNNNFVNIFGAREVFDVSDVLNDTSSLVTDNAHLLVTPKSSVRDAQGEFTLLMDFAEMNTTSEFNVSESYGEISDLLSSLPGTPFDYDSRVDQDKMDDSYLYNVSEFSWNNASTGDITYRSALENLNIILADMVPNVLGGADFPQYYDTYNFTMVRNLTRDEFCLSSTDFFPDSSTPQNSLNLGYQIYTYDGQYDNLCGNVTTVLNITEVIDELVATNDETRVDLVDIQHNLGLIDGNLTNIAQAQENMATLALSMNGSLNYLVDVLDSLVVDLDDLADDLQGINDVVMGAPNYTMCGYIGDFYQKVYIEGMCEGLQEDVSAVAGPTLAVVILMFLSFCLQGCYGPSMRKRPQPLPSSSEGKERFNKTNLAQTNNLATPHSPSPLLGEQGF